MIELPRRKGNFDPLYELEMHRALLAAAKLRADQRLVPALAAEVAYWTAKVEKEHADGD